MYRALKSFSGLISMAKGQIRDIKDENIINDLLRCGYIEEIKDEKNEIKKDIEKKEEKEKTTSRRRSKK